MNNLYGLALSQNLPYGGFEWIVDEANLKTIVENLPSEDSDVGYVLIFDLHVPVERHNQLADLPPAP